MKRFAIPVAALLLAVPEEAPAAGWIAMLDHGDARLPPAYSAMLDHIVQWSQVSGIRCFRVDGHTDRSGSTFYNHRLALRRARTVKAALVARGLPASAIEVRALGESRPLVETADGVPHGQNRRVEVYPDESCRPAPQDSPPG
jgi:outer membrane protein OmpA-like peptidoglycan-associated protein